MKNPFRSFQFPTSSVLIMLSIGAGLVIEYIAASIMYDNAQRIGKYETGELPVLIVIITFCVLLIGWIAYFFIQKRINQKRQAKKNNT